ncbi:hypothetical protein N0V84_006155 [Fusarium piperis]|uniref:Uncharacterized protein n=1 Tax=Fusarium piperis TaxID=1435070 RepID=A0A9W8WCF7_9HYPO|nr:hypothetical protein N0V84_006155 [Fusarium piperis]
MKSLKQLIDVVSRPHKNSEQVNNTRPVFIDHEIAEMFVDKLISEIEIENKNNTNYDKPKDPGLAEADANVDAKLVRLINADKNPWPEDPSYRVMRVTVQMPPTTPVPERIERTYASRGERAWAKVIAWGRFQLTDEYPGGEFYDLWVLPSESRMEWVGPVPINLAKKSISLADPLQLGKKRESIGEDEVVCIGL